MADAGPSETCAGMEIPVNNNNNMDCNEIDTEAPGFILVNQSGQLVTAAELTAAINQQMQLYALENQQLPSGSASAPPPPPFPVVLSNYIKPSATNDNDDQTQVQQSSLETMVAKNSSSTIVAAGGTNSAAVALETIVRKPSNNRKSPPADPPGDVNSNCLNEDDSSSLQEMLSTMEASIVSRLEGFNRKVENVEKKCRKMETQIKSIFDQIKDHYLKNKVAISTGKKRPGTIVVGFKSSLTNQDLINKMNSTPQVVPPKIRRIPYSSEDDFPNGSWLGLASDPEKRVRCSISEFDLTRINQCRTPEKLALTLLDHLFDRETQAHSNLSGLGRHSKRQLDPRKIYGIRCHIHQRFNIDEKDWHRIKQNIDSKCRTAFRRKRKGMSIQVKSYPGRSSNNTTNNNANVHFDPVDETNTFDHDGDTNNNLREDEDQDNSSEHQILSSSSSLLRSVSDVIKMNIIDEDPGLVHEDEERLRREDDLRGRLVNEDGELVFKRSKSSLGTDEDDGSRSKTIVVPIAFHQSVNSDGSAPNDPSSSLIFALHHHGASSLIPSSVGIDGDDREEQDEELSQS